MNEQKQAPSPQPQLQVAPHQISLVTLPSLPGVRRDGTDTDSDFFNDAQWCRFVRNRPRKMGGYVESSSFFSGPIYGGFLWSRQFMNTFCAFSKYGVEFTLMDQNGLCSAVQSINPAGYTTNTNALWSYDYLFDAASGANATLLIASPNNTLQNMDDPTLTSVYVTPLNSPATMTVVADAKAVCSGGIFCTPPYTVLLGNDGNVTWSDANAPQDYTNGDAGSARVTGSKVVKGLPMRTGVSSGGLLWSLDSVIRMDWIGGSQIFKFSHISTKSSILSQRSVIEFDGKWYWVGLDRFMVTNGVQVEELPNDMNLNWFFDNLNFSQRQKVFAMKMPRFGEIWWFFPFGNAEECNHAVIYNVRNKLWYDTEIDRAWGFTPATYRYPLMTSTQEGTQSQLTLTISSGTLETGDQVFGSTTGAGGSVLLVSGAGPYTVIVTSVNNLTFSSSENYTTIISASAAAAGRTGAAGALSATKSLYSVFSHENGHDAVIGQNVEAIASWFTTCDFGIPTGGPQLNSVQGQDFYTRIKRIEPDFILEGEMTAQVIKRKFAQSEDENGMLYTFDSSTGKIDLREQAREFRLKFSSNTQGGHYEGGKTLVHLEPGDVRP